MIGVLYEIKDVISGSGYYEPKVDITKKSVTFSMHRYYSGKPYIAQHHIEELEEIEKKHNVEILLKANKSTFTIIVSEKKKSLFDFGAKREEFKVNEDEIKEIITNLLSACLPLHALESLKKALEYAKDLDELSKRPEFDELIKRGIIHDPPEVIAEEELQFRMQKMIEQFRKLGIIVQKLRYLGIPYQIRTYPLADMLRVPVHDIEIKQRILKLSDLKFLTEDVGLLRVHFEPHDFNWLWVFF